MLLSYSSAADATAANITRVNAVNAASVTLPCQSFDEADSTWTLRSLVTGQTDIISADGLLNRDFSEQFVLTPAWSGWQNLTVKRVGRSNEGLYTCKQATRPRRVTLFEVTLTGIRMLRTGFFFPRVCMHISVRLLVLYYYANCCCSCSAEYTFCTGMHGEMSKT